MDASNIKTLTRHHFSKLRKNESTLGRWHISDKGYPRFHSGIYKGQYVHRVIVKLMLGRELKKDEDVHHKNGNKADFRKRNLKVLDHREHGYWSNKQRMFLKLREESEKQEWEQFYAETKETTQDSELADISFEVSSFSAN